jgi:hypothetical protein
VAVSKENMAEVINVEYGLAGGAVMTDGDISSLGESVVRARLRDAKAKSHAALLAEAAKIKADATKQKSGAGACERRRAAAGGGSGGGSMGRVSGRFEGGGGGARSST